VREPVSGKSSALNTGIRVTHRELVGIVDDDEEVAPDWFAAVAAAFADPEVDFIGGPCLPRWGAAPPGWLPPSWRGVIGYVDNGPEELVFQPHGTAILMGGNAVLRRRTLEQAGGYSERLGPRAERRLFSCEDQDLYDRLMAAGAYGLYVPQLRIYHYVPERRLTKSYYRRWSFWNGVSRSVLESLRPSPVRRIGRVPRYLFGTAARDLVRGVRAARSDSAATLEAQLALLHLIGFVYGSYRYRGGRSS
jgi:glycosyltransferase involved in cell wall biosynthesis